MKVVTFGESLFRLSTIRGERVSRAHTMNFYLGGTELNVAANLQSLGVSASWISAIADGETGNLIRHKVSEYGVDNQFCVTIPKGQAGWYLMETGAAPRPDVVLNRNASSMAQMKEFNFDWKKIFAGASVFHTSGVTSGLSLQLTDEVKSAMKVAREAKLLVSYDFNYRKNIWSIDEFVSRQKDLIPFIDILFCAESDLKLFFKDKSLAQIFEETNLKIIVLSRRSEDETEYGVDVVTKTQTHPSKRHRIQCVDRIGVGDSMTAGFLKAYLESKSESTAAEWAALCGAMKYGIAGDMALLTSNEIQSFLETGYKGIIR